MPCVSITDWATELVLSSLGDEPEDIIELFGNMPGDSRPSSGGRPTPGVPTREACRPGFLTLVLGKSDPEIIVDLAAKLI